MFEEVEEEGPEEEEEADGMAGEDGVWWCEASKLRSCECSSTSPRSSRRSRGSFRRVALLFVPALETPA